MSRTASLPTELSQAAFMVKAYRVHTGAVELTDASSVATIHIELASNAPLPARALDPVLYVGAQEVRDYVYDDGDQTLIFAESEGGRLQPTKTLTFGWAQPVAGAQLQEAQELAFDFDPATLPVHNAGSPRGDATGSP